MVILMNIFDPNIHLAITNNWVTVTNFSYFAYQLFDKETSYVSEITEAIENGWIDESTDIYQRLKNWDGTVHKFTLDKTKTIGKVPTGLLYIIQGICEKYSFPYDITDQRVRPDPDISGISAIPLRPYQEEAVLNAIKTGRGVIDACPRSGKTRIFCEIVRRLFLDTIWIVPTDKIADQSLNTVEQFLGKGIGVHQVGSQGIEDLKHIKVVIATVATATDLPQEFYNTRKLLIFDEFHHGGSISARKIFKKAEKCYYRIGGTGTFSRDGADILDMYALLSNVVYKITPIELVKLGFLVNTKVFILPVITTKVRGGGNSFMAGFGKIGIFENEYRNNMVAQATQILYKKGKNVLILVGTKKQGVILKNLLVETLGNNRENRFGIVENVSAETDRKILTEILHSFENKEGNVKIVIGTSLMAEGVDLPNADALVLARGGRGDVSLTQASFRVNTKVAGKEYGIVVDFSDRHSARLLKHSVERLKIYYKQPTFSIKILKDLSDLEKEEIL